METYRVRIEVAGHPIKYVASASSSDALLTVTKHEARRFRGSLNADIAAGMWERTLRNLGLVADAFIEEAST